MAVINAVKNSVNPYNVDSIAEVLATAAVQSWDYYEDSCAKIMDTRDWFSQELQAIGFDVLPSKTNFVLVKPHGVTAGQLFDYLQSKENLCPLFSKSGAYFRQTTHLYWNSG